MRETQYHFAKLKAASDTDTLRELAECLDVSERTVQKYKAQKYLRPELARELARRIGTTPQKVWPNWDEPEPVATQEKVVVTYALEAVVRLIRAKVVKNDDATKDKVCELLGMKREHLDNALAITTPTRSKFAPIAPVTGPASIANSKVKNAPAGMRGCARCLKVKPLSSFGIKDKRRNVVSSYCKPCWRQIQSQRWLRASELGLVTEVRSIIEKGDWRTKSNCVVCFARFHVGDEIQAADSRMAHTDCLDAKAAG